MDDFFKQVREAQREALKNRILANTVFINGRLGLTQRFTFGNCVLPPMICGLELKVTNELPDNVSFAITEAVQTEREKLIAETRAETAKEIFKSIWESMVFMCRVENTPAKEQCENLINQFDKIIINLAKEYGVEIEE